MTRTRSLRHDPRAAHRTRGIPLAAAGMCIVLLCACGASTTTSTAATVAAPPAVEPTTSVVATTDLPATTPDTIESATTTTATTTPPATVPPTTPPTVPTTTPPTTAPPTTAPPTTAPPVNVVLDLNAFETSHEESGGGINSQNGWRLDPAAHRVQATTGHGPFAIAEAADVAARIHSTFQPPSPDATLTWNVDWSGYATSFIGADSSARVRVTVRVYEVTGGDVPSRGPVVFERALEDDGVGAALQGVATAQWNDGDNQSVVLPALDPERTYRVEAELRCTSRVAFSIGTTVCDFQKEPTSGLHVSDWELVFQTPPSRELVSG